MDFSNDDETGLKQAIFDSDTLCKKGSGRERVQKDIEIASGWIEGRTRRCEGGPSRAGG